MLFAQEPSVFAVLLQELRSYSVVLYSCFSFKQFIFGVSVVVN